MQNNRQFLVPWSGVVLMLFIIFSLTFQSPKGTTELSGWFQAFLLSIFGDHAPAWLHDMHWVRSYAHIPLYCALALTLYPAFKVTLHRGIAWAGLLAISAGAAVGLLDETVKIFIPGREFDLVDWGLDIIAVVAGVGIYVGIEKLWSAVKNSGKSISSVTSRCS